MLQCLCASYPAVGSESWALTQKHTHMLEVVHSDCLRQILGVRLCQHHKLSYIRSECSTVSLADMLRAARLRWLGHVVRMGADRLPKQALMSQLHDVGAARRGRPRASWESCIAQDLDAMGLPLCMHDLSAHCDIRSSWRSMVYKITHPHADGLPFHRSQASHQRHMAHVQWRAGRLQPPAMSMSDLMARQAMRALSD